MALHTEADGDHLPKFSGCRVYASGTQTIANDTATAVAYNTEDSPADTDAYHDTVTNNTRITIPATTIYELGAAVQWVSNATGVRTISIRKNGAADFPALQRQGAVNGATTDQDCHTGPISCSAGDYFEVVVRQTSGGNLDLSAGAAGEHIAFWIRRLE